MYLKLEINKALSIKFAKAFLIDLTPTIIPIRRGRKIFLNKIVNKN